MELIYKYLISEEQEIIDCLISNNPNRDDWGDSLNEIKQNFRREKLKSQIKNVKRGVTRLGGVAACDAMPIYVDKLACKIKVYQKYADMLQADLPKADTKYQEELIRDKIKKANKRLRSWEAILKTERQGAKHKKKEKEELEKAEIFKRSAEFHATKARRRKRDANRERVRQSINWNKFDI